MWLQKMKSSDIAQIICLYIHKYRSTCVCVTFDISVTTISEVTDIYVAKRDKIWLPNVQ